MKVLAALLLVFVSLVSLRAGEAESEIRSVLDAQVQAWNRGDIPTFVRAYTTDCIFVGKEIAHGRAKLETRYKKSYPTRAAMGHLIFIKLEVHSLNDQVALVTGEWHIDRGNSSNTDASTKSIGGLFSLVFHHEPGGWKIALDHTS